MTQKRTSDTLPIKRMGSKEKDRFTTLTRAVGLLSGVESLKGAKPLPELLDYGKNPMTRESYNTIQKYIAEVNRTVGHLKYQVNMALHMKAKRERFKRVKAEKEA